MAKPAANGAVGDERRQIRASRGGVGGRAPRDARTRNPPNLPEMTDRTTAMATAPRPTQLSL